MTAEEETPQDPVNVDGKADVPEACAAPAAAGAPEIDQPASEHKTSEPVSSSNTSQPQKRDAAHLERQRRATAAAIAAVAHAAPGQRERVMNEAIAAASAPVPDAAAPPAEPQYAF